MTLQPWAGSADGSTATGVHSVAVVALLFVLAFFAHFSRANGFGFYEDDWFLLGPLIDRVKLNWYVINWALQNPDAYGGRPIGFMLMRAFIAVFHQTDNVRDLYIGAWLMIGTNTALFYFILKRALPRHWAFAGAALFLLHPADSTRQFLVHATFLQFSLLFVLCYIATMQSRFWPASPLLLPLPLLTYESLYPIALIAPLLCWQSRLRTVGMTLTGNTIIVLLVGGVYALYRYSSGEVRVSTASDATAQRILDSLAAWLQADLTAITTFLYWPIALLRTPHASTLLVGLVLAGAVLAGTTYLMKRKDRFPEQPGHPRQYVQVILAGLILVAIGGIAAALITLYGGGPNLESVAGRGTRFYVTSGIGVVLTIGGTVSYLESRALSPHRIRLAGQLTVGTLCFFYGAYASKVQQDYVLAWKTSASLLNQISAAAPDLDAGEVILVEGDKETPSVIPGTTPAIEAFEGFGYALEALYELDHFDVESRPKVFFAPPGWEQSLTPDDAGCLKWQRKVLPTDWRGQNLICPNSVILLHYNGRVVERLAGPYVQHGMNIIKPTPEISGRERKAPPSLPFDRRDAFRLLQQTQ